MSLRRFYPPCFLSIGAEDHDTWLPPERMYLEHLSDNHIPKAGIGHLLDRPVEIRWWHLLADPDRMTCQGQDRCCRYTPSTAYLETGWCVRFYELFIKYKAEIIDLFSF